MSPETQAILEDLTREAWNDALEIREYILKSFSGDELTEHQLQGKPVSTVLKWLERKRIPALEVVMFDLGMGIPNIPEVKAGMRVEKLTSYTDAGGALYAVKWRLSKTYEGYPVYCAERTSPSGITQDLVEVRKDGVVYVLQDNKYVKTKLNLVCKIADN